jgi:amino acid transporter, AAT family
MPWAPYTNWLVLAFFLFVTVTIAWEADTRVALYVMAAWVAVIVIGWPFVRLGAKVERVKVAVAEESTSA